MQPPTAGMRLRVLGPIELAGLDQPLSSQQLSLVTFLACVGPARRERLVDALWDGRPVSAGRFANLVSGVRRRLGPRHLPVGQGGWYRLVDVPVDSDTSIDAGELPGIDRSVTDWLDVAVSRMGSPVMTPPTTRWWGWLDDHPEVIVRAEVAAAEVAHRVVGHLSERGELARAQSVCERALAANPLDRDLVAALAELYRVRGRPGAAHRLIERWQHRVPDLARAG